LNLNAILATNDLFVPVLADFLSYHGLKILFETLSSVEEEFSYQLENIYIVINRFNPTQNISVRSQEAIKQHYAQFVLKTVIRQNTTISDATAQQKSVFEVAPSSRAAQDIDKMINEVFELKESAR
jgi:chromosome partitioning protein